MEMTLVGEKTVHIIDQRDDRGVKMPIYLKISTHDIPSVCHTRGGEEHDGWFSHPSSTEKAKFDSALLSMGIEVYRGKQ